MELSDLLLLEVQFASVVSAELYIHQPTHFKKLLQVDTNFLNIKFTIPVARLGRYNNGFTYEGYEGNVLLGT